MKQHSQRFVKLAENARQQVREITVEKVKEKIESGDISFLIDVREANEWQQGHLPHALHLSKGVIERDIEKHIPDEQSEIILYCGGGFRSALAGENLQRMGYKNILSMAGGFTAWKNAGFPIENE